MKPPPEVQILGVPGMPEVTWGDDLAELIVAALDRAHIRAKGGDVFVVAQKIVSKSEGRLVQLDQVAPSPLARAWAKVYSKDPRLIELVLRQSKRIVRMERGIIISETEHGFVCANAGVDESNVTEGFATLLPEDPDRSARQIRERLERRLGLRVAVIISDTFGRPWREGLTNVALGVSGIAPLKDWRGKADWLGRPLKATIMATADEVASAAELVMGKDAGIPVAIVRGLSYEESEANGRMLIRPASSDLFR
jgi:coenzyme F420-0:L-glutamate ligase/coenzyme F420-1:gamma-L-glutamate ligase